MNGSTARLDKVAELAHRAGGVTNADLQAVLRLSPTAAGALLSHAETRLDLYKVPRSGQPGDRMRWFGSLAGAKTFALQRERDLAAQAAPRPPGVKPPRAPRPTRPQCDGQPAECIRLKNSRPPKRPAQAAPLQPVITGSTKVTVLEHKPEAHRLNLFAPPLPVVPGWGGGPVLREGALDYKRHQRHGSPAAAQVQP